MTEPREIRNDRGELVAIARKSCETFQIQPEEEPFDFEGAYDVINRLEGIADYFGSGMPESKNTCVTSMLLLRDAIERLRKC